MKYKCTVCGHVYDPDLGDPDAGVPAKTAYEQLPEHWSCPGCGATRGELEADYD